MSPDQEQIVCFMFQVLSNDTGLLSGIDTKSARLETAKPRTILDLNGSDLFFDVDIFSGQGERIGVLRTSAGREQIPVIDSIIFGNIADPELLITRALDKAKLDYPDHEVKATQFICYGYPYVGVLVTLATANGDRWMIVNPYARLVVREGVGAYTRAIAESQGTLYEASTDEGEPVYSLLYAIPEAGPDPTEAELQWIGLRKVAQKSMKFLEFERPKVSVKGSIEAVNLIPQQTPVYCVVATAAMILNHVGVARFTQQEIAVVLGTGKKGTPPLALAEKIGQLSNELLDAMQISTPTFEQFVEGLQANLPVKSGIHGHSRLVRGYKQYDFLDENGRTEHSERFLVVNDPQPMNYGGIVLENMCKPIPEYYVNALVLKFKN